MDLIQKEFPDVDAIVGTATAGIPQAAWVVPFKITNGLCKNKEKEHGRGNKLKED